MIKILDKYLIKNYLKYYTLSLLVLMFLFLVIDVATLINRFQAPGSVFLSYYINYIPWMASQMMPISGVMATVFLFVNLQKHSELVVCYSLGVSLFRVLLPVLIVLSIISGLGWVLIDKIVPAAMEKRNYHYYVDLKKMPGRYNKLKKSNVWFRNPVAIINFGRVVSESKVSNASVYFYDKETWRPNRIIKAKEVVLNDNSWEFKSGTETTYALDEVKNNKFTSLKTEALEDLTEFKQTQSNLNSMSLSQLSYAIKKGKESSMATQSLETEFHGKLSFIFSAIFLSLLSLPFCIGNARSSNVFVGMAISLCIVLGYWIVYSTLLNMGKVGTIGPIFAGWGATLISLVSSVFLLKRKV